MANLTISVDELLLKRAGINALAEGTSVNALPRTCLEAYAGTQRNQRALAGFAELAERSEATSGAAGRTWSRDDLHDRTEPS